MRSPPPPLPFCVFAAAACSLPVLGLCLHHGWGHEGDLRFFHAWARAFAEGPAFYRDGPGVNYPILGVLLVCVPSNGWVALTGDALDYPTFRAVHKAVLVAGEVALVFVSARLARTVGAPRPRWLALALLVLPSTWAGGAWFGQTDVFGSVALVAAADGLVRYRRSGASGDLACGLLGLHAALLLKQLTWFALPPLVVLLVVGLRGTEKRAHLAMAGSSVLLWFVADPYLDLPDGHVSHLAFVIARSARDHGSLLVANGASAWVFLRSSGLSATDPWLGPMTPSQVGWTAWALTAGAGTAWALRAFRRGWRTSDVRLVTAAGVSSLAMALLLTGVHERYLVHGIPLLFVTTRGRVRWAVAGLGVVTGAFVLGNLHPAWAWAGRPEPVLFAGVFCLGLMAASGCAKIGERTLTRESDPP